MIMNAIKEITTVSSLKGIRNSFADHIGDAIHVQCWYVKEEVEWLVLDFVEEAPIGDVLHGFHNMLRMQSGDYLKESYFFIDALSKN